MELRNTLTMKKASTRVNLLKKVKYFTSTVKQLLWFTSPWFSQSLRSVHFLHTVQLQNILKITPSPWKVTLKGSLGKTIGCEVQITKNVYVYVLMSINVCMVMCVTCLKTISTIRKRKWAPKTMGAWYMYHV